MRKHMVVAYSVTSSTTQRHIIYCDLCVGSFENSEERVVDSLARMAHQDIVEIPGSGDGRQRRSYVEAIGYERELALTTCESTAELILFRYQSY